MAEQEVHGAAGAAQTAEETRPSPSVQEAPAGQALKGGKAPSPARRSRSSAEKRRPRAANPAAAAPKERPASGPAEEPAAGKGTAAKPATAPRRKKAVPKPAGALPSETVHTVGSAQEPAVPADGTAQGEPSLPPVEKKRAGAAKPRRARKKSTSGPQKSPEPAEKAAEPPEKPDSAPENAAQAAPPPVSPQDEAGAPVPAPEEEPAQPAQTPAAPAAEPPEAVPAGLPPVQALPPEMEFAPDNAQGQAQRRERVRRKAADVQVHLETAAEPQACPPAAFPLFDGDPEEEEAPRRRGTKHAAARRQVHGRALWGGCTLAVLAAAALMLWAALSQYFPAAQPAPVSASVSVPASPASVQEDYSARPRDPSLWSLLLTNTDNPLPQGYAPTLASVGSNARNGEQFVDERIRQPLLEMLEAAEKDGIYLIVRSAYRSTAEQTKLFNDMLQGYVSSYGYSYDQAYAATKQWRNVPGTSEHETGLSADLVGQGYIDAALTESLADTDWAKWLLENAADYGFILRYPKDKSAVTGTSFEPWHYRYVGVEDAQKIRSLGVCLEEYLGADKTSQAAQTTQEKD